MDDTLHLNSSKAIDLEWLAGSTWIEFIFYVDPLRVIPELLNGPSHGFPFLHVHKLLFEQVIGLWNPSVSREDQREEITIEWTGVGDTYELMDVIANEFGHRIINSDEMAELMDSGSPEEFDRLCDEAIGRG